MRALNMLLISSQRKALALSIPDTAGVPPKQSHSVPPAPSPCLADVFFRPLQTPISGTFSSACSESRSRGRLAPRDRCVFARHCDALRVQVPILGQFLPPTPTPVPGDVFFPPLQASVAGHFLPPAPSPRLGDVSLYVINAHLPEIALPLIEAVHPAAPI